MVVVLPPALLLSIEIERLLLQLVWVVFCTRAWTDTAPWPSRALPLAAHALGRALGVDALVAAARSVQRRARHLCRRHAARPRLAGAARGHAAAAQAARAICRGAAPAEPRPRVH